MFEDRDIAQIDATVIVGVLILASMTTINPNIPNIRIAEAFAITWEMILPFAISGVLALAGRTKIAKILTAPWICTFNHNIICGMARNLPNMNQLFMVLLIPEDLVAHLWTPICSIISYRTK